MANVSSCTPAFSGKQPHATRPATSSPRLKVIASQQPLVQSGEFQSHMSRRFTLETAESLLPEIEKGLRDALAFKAALDEAQGELQAVAQRVMMLGGVLVDREKTQQSKLRRDQYTENLKNTVHHIQELGCLIKDLDIGLVDFPTLFRGEEVYLCWKLGEPAIEYWHGTHEGFAGRKAIDEEFRESHRGDAPH